MRQETYYKGKWSNFRQVVPENLDTKSGWLARGFKVTTESPVAFFRSGDGKIHPLFEKPKTVVKKGKPRKIFEEKLEEAGIEVIALHLDDREHIHGLVARNRK